MNIKVRVMTNNNGNKVPNQYIIINNGETTFQSYNSVICTISHTKNTIVFGKDWDYSKTTVRYLNQFLNEIIGWETKSSIIRKAIADNKVELPYCTYTVCYDRFMV